jgi:hypothetical protein
MPRSPILLLKVKKDVIFIKRSIFLEAAYTGLERWEERSHLLVACRI